MKMKDLPDEDLFTAGHTACPGCGVAMSIRNAIRILGKDTSVYVPASCAVVFGSTYPYGAWKVPFFHTAFENTGACLAGMQAAFEKKGEKAKSIKGFRFLHMYTPCVPGWKIDPAKTIAVTKLAVESGMWTLYEVENGEKKITHKPGKMKSVKEYLMMQGRFRHMSPEDLKKLQGWVCKKWNLHYKEKGAPEVCEIEIPE